MQLCFIPIADASKDLEEEKNKNKKQQLYAVTLLLLKEKVTGKKEERFGVVNGEENEIKYKEVERSYNIACEGMVLQF